MNKLRSVNFPATGYAVCELDHDDMQPLWREATQIMQNFGSATPYNEQLLGNIKHEYQLTQCLPHIQQLSRRLASVFHGWMPRPDHDLVLRGAWINFQRKNEFNPPHIHDGDLVIVIYLQIPYSREQEVQHNPLPPGKNYFGMFNFQYIGHDGKIMTFPLETDKSFENHMILFPAWLTHSVNPFSSSDQYRISISGNLYSQPCLPDSAPPTYKPKFDFHL